MSDKEEGQDQEGMADDWAAALEEQGDAEAGDAPAEGGKAAKPEGSPMALDVFEGSGNADPVTAETIAAGGPKLDVILDIPVRLSMEVGNTEINIRNLLQLNQGSVIELDRLAGEPLDVLVNGTLIAHGEVVVVNEKFGIRLTDVISPTERIKRLQ